MKSEEFPHFSLPFGWGPRNHRTYPSVPLAFPW